LSPRSKIDSLEVVEVLSAIEVAAGSEQTPVVRRKKPLSWRTERPYWAKGIRNIVGIDEAGRGPLAGPVVASALMFTYDRCQKFPKTLRDLNDSKQLTEEERERFFDLIQKHAYAIGVGIVSPQEIDRINILQATMLAMTLAVNELEIKLQLTEEAPELLLIDGNYFRTPLPYEFKTVIDGDAKSPLIAAASIIAKVTRDRLMKEMHERYPVYNFAQHKGYATREHIKAIETHGLSAEHRLSFRKDRIEETLSLFAADLEVMTITELEDGVG
jgi:ribonuclease HII